MQILARCITIYSRPSVAYGRMTQNYNAEAVANSNLEVSINAAHAKEDMEFTVSRDIRVDGTNKMPDTVYIDYI